ncbi:MAG: transcription antitermination factor NusB [Bacteroidales bacterium]|nr:transcription antitermination factor NusB [Bacteroidales bacterium]
MLNRRQLRIKTLQGLYAFLCSGETDLAKGREELIKSIDNMGVLFVWQISLVLEMADFASKIIEERKHKFLPTEEDLNPDYRFVNNRLIAQWNDNRDIQAKIEKYHVSWIESSEVIRRLYNLIETSDAYNQYLKSEDTYANDKEFVITLYADFIFEEDFFIDFYETKNIYWYTDFCISNYLIVRFIDECKETNDEYYKLPSLFKKENDSNGDEDDRNFCLSLFTKTVMNYDKYKGYVEEKVVNWEIDRVAPMDILILVMAISEMINFPTIPIKVTLNEYIELSKIFSTPKSKFFINGILDNLVVSLQKDGKIIKTGRGLIDKNSQS